MLLTREWYMHPNGQLPAYEWEFGDVNPPVHAWAAWRVFQIDRKQRTATAAIWRFWNGSSTSCCSISPGGSTARIPQGRNIFQGGFLGLDNIGVSTAASRCRPAASSTRPTAPAGWRCIA